MMLWLLETCCAYRLNCWPVWNAEREERALRSYQHLFTIRLDRVLRG